jgi:peptide/nickel transport system substrate-binding protein
VCWDTVPPREVTADDFVRGFKRMCNPVAGAGAIAYYTSTIRGMAEFAEEFRRRFAGSAPTAAELAGYQNAHPIPGLRGVDDRTLVIELVRPANDLLNLLAMTFASAAPREYDAVVPASPELVQRIRSNGPYRVTEYVPGQRLVMERNPAWRAESDPIRRGYVDRIAVRMEKVSDERVREVVESGEADLSWGAAVGDRGGTAPDADRRLGFALNPYLAFNMHSPNAGAAVRSVTVRRAIAYAIDKARLVKFFDDMDIGTVTCPAHTAIPPGNFGYREYDRYPTPGDAGDPARCRSLLAEAGYAGGLTLRMLHRVDAVHAEVAAAIAEDLAEGGIDARLLTIDQTDEYYRILQNPVRAAAGEWDITPAAWTPDWFGNNGRAYVQPMFQSNTAAGTANYGGYSNPDVDRVITEALSEPDPARAEDLWHRVDRQVLEDVAIVPILACEPTIRHVASARVRNAIPLPQVDRWYDAANLWLDPPD